ncbi:IS1-like element transposase [Pantoea stewartii subsp. indologenes]|uniref:IS1-like element transposase n=1 Tax=Pantoea stewartii TaxID=66269 RepID=UPI003FA49D3A
MGQLKFTYTAPQPVTHLKIIDMDMNRIKCHAIAGIICVTLNVMSCLLKPKAKVSDLAHATGQRLTMKALEIAWVTCPQY